MRTYIVYIPGLGTRYNGFRKFALSLWRVYGVSTKLVPLNWYDDATFEEKMDQVKRAINQANQHTRVVVIGESAGATLAIRSSSLPKVNRVITLCGVAQPSTPISPHLQVKAPALLEATRSIPNISYQNMHSVRAVADPVVGKKYSLATGATSHVIWMVGHFTTIVFCLTILSPLMVTIAKSSKT